MNVVHQVKPIRLYNNHKYCFLILARYNIPPIRAVDLSTHRGHHHSITNTSILSLSPPPIGPIGPRRKTKSKSGMKSRIFFISHCLFSFSSNV
jgi:hypothetical protein